ncbi:inovirus Gp2 family protein [Vibrio aestuarianus]|uniref:inovirus Gp2 family protein n=1 Tax=Vibrio aestuarianus TaxID=28171 RepID=UPI00237C9DB6|nr:inovirus Gp2 family protein [Vibrio aestuarianus]MDE1348524.1 inovirus Gp2 family protein [Vibrio aestuarianus]
MHKHPTNKNLTIIEAATYNGLPLIVNTRHNTYYPYIEQYLESNKRVMDDALSTHPRTLAVRVDLHFPPNYFDPDYPRYNSKPEISRFIESFKSKQNSLIVKRRRNGSRAHPSFPSYIWAKEYDNEVKAHYHLIIFLNNDTFRRLGAKTTPNEASPLVNIIVEAWESALNISYRKAWNLVTIPDNASYKLKQVTSPEEDNVYRNLFKRLSYFAKENTKTYGDRQKNYSCSQKSSQRHR